MASDDDIIISGEAVIHPGDLHEDFIRSSGPGGQNVNKVATAVQLRFDAANASGLSERVRERAIKLAGQRATKDGVIVIEAGRFRTQEQNRADARERLSEMLREAHRLPEKRAKSRLNRVGKTQRLEGKKKRGAVKAGRGKVRLD